MIFRGCCRRGDDVCGADLVDATYPRLSQRRVGAWQARADGGSKVGDSRGRGRSRKPRRVSFGRVGPHLADRVEGGISPDAVGDDVEDENLGGALIGAGGRMWVLAPSGHATRTGTTFDAKVGKGLGIDGDELKYLVERETFFLGFEDARVQVLCSDALSCQSYCRYFWSR